MPGRAARVLGTALLGWLMLQGQPWGAESPPPPIPAARPSRPPASLPPTAPADGARAQSELALILVRNVFVALGQAIATGNYSVLRDLAAPGFRRDFPESRLVAVFAPLQQAGIDFSPVVLMLPQLERAEILEGGLLRLGGIMPTRPSAVRFEFLFQALAGGWQLLGISVAPIQLPSAPAKGLASPASAVQRPAQATPRP